MFKSLFPILLMTNVLCSFAQNSNNFTVQSRIVEDGGTGNYKSVMAEVNSLKAHTVFYPQDLTKFNSKNPLPVLVWGNGACSNSPWEHYLFLNEIASHGFLVVATGFFPKDDTPYQGDMSTPEQQVQSIDWAIAQNQDNQYQGYMCFRYVMWRIANPLQLCRQAHHYIYDM